MLGKIIEVCDRAGWRAVVTVIAVIVAFPAAFIIAHLDEKKRKDSSWEGYAYEFWVEQRRKYGVVIGEKFMIEVATDSGSFEYKVSEAIWDAVEYDDYLVKIPNTTDFMVYRNGEQVTNNSLFVQLERPLTEKGIAYFRELNAVETQVAGAGGGEWLGPGEAPGPGESYIDRVNTQHPSNNIVYGPDGFPVSQPLQQVSPPQQQPPQAAPSNPQPSSQQNPRALYNEGIKLWRSGQKEASVKMIEHAVALYAQTYGTGSAEYADMYKRMQVAKDTLVDEQFSAIVGN